MLGRIFHIQRVDAQSVTITMRMGELANGLKIKGMNSRIDAIYYVFYSSIGA